MIAPREPAFRVISLGLLPQEQNALEQMSAQLGGLSETAKDDMDLYRLAQTGLSSICIIGQTDTSAEPSYSFWLLKGLVHPTKVILVYTTLTDEEAKTLDRYEALNIMTRPLDPKQMARMIESALSAREDQKEGLLSSLRRFNPFRRQAATH